MLKTWVTNLLIFTTIIMVAGSLIVTLVLRNNEFSADCTAAGGRAIVGRDIRLCVNPNSLVKVN
jgi:uncharacterized membrane protein YqgA involved in biofilm formation